MNVIYIKCPNNFEIFSFFGLKISFYDLKIDILFLIIKINRLTEDYNTKLLKKLIVAIFIIINLFFKKKKVTKKMEIDKKNGT